MDWFDMNNTMDDPFKNKPILFIIHISGVEELCELETVFSLNDNSSITLTRASIWGECLFEI
jgi:hypothetical protein